MRLTAAALLCFSAAMAQTTDGITATPSTLSFTYQVGAAMPAEQKVQVKRTGAGAALDFTVTVAPASPWLIVTPMAGRTGTSIGLRVNPTSLLAGTYQADVQIAAAGVINPAVVAVTLAVKNPPPTAGVQPAAIPIAFQTDQAAPSAQTITVTSSGEPVSFTAAVTGAWLSVSPALGIAVAGRPVTLTVSLDTAGLVPAIYNGKVTLAFSNAANKSLVVPVTLTVTPGVAVVSSLWPNSAPVGSTDTTVTLRGSHFFQASVVQAGNTTLTSTWVSTGVLLAVIPQALLANQGTLAITVTNAPQAASAAADFTVTAPGPRIQSVANAASFATSATPVIAPGEVISIFGSGLGPGTLLPADASGGSYPTSLGNPATLVEFELSPNTWTAAPLIFAQANQVDAVAPMALAPATGLKLRVTYNGIVSSSFTFDAVDAEPGVFTVDASGRGQGAILNYNANTGAYTLNSAANAATRGSIVAIYLTGGGVYASAVADGAVIPLSGAAPALKAAPSVTIGGDGASVQSATAVPGAVAGLVQLNVTVPGAVNPGKNLPVVVSIAGRASPATATIAVK
ncbi:MAG: hypothetical protein M1436_09790 [Acidobacteria bacterium]|nr:hypothetical protein [Acidobacteriota bacterium]